MEVEGMKPKNFDPLPKFDPPPELQIRIGEKRKAAMAILRTHDGTKGKKRWLGIPVTPRTRRVKDNPAVPFERRVNER